METALSKGLFFFAIAETVILKALSKFQVDIPINARITAVQSLENVRYIYITAAMLVGKRMPTSPFSHMA